VNCHPDLTQELQDKDFNIPVTIRQVGLKLGSDMSTIKKETLQKIKCKGSKAMYPYYITSHILHRATFVNSAMILFYNHVVMALPAMEDDLQLLYNTKKKCPIMILT
jgi:hypothetical protein